MNQTRRNGGAPTTIKDVAASLGVSITTVSRALTAPEMLSEQTRARVLAGIEEMGYQPNLLARDLRTRSSKLAFVVVPSLSPFFLEVFRGVEKAAGELGYTLLMGHTDRSPAREQVFFDQVASRRADGIILVSSSHALSIKNRTRRMPPIVIALEAIEGSNLPTVRVNHTLGAVHATEHLLSLGHRRIAHISGPSTTPMAVHRVEGYKDALAAKGVAFDASLLVEGDFTIDSGERAMRELLGRNPQPSAVFVANDEMAIGAIRAAKLAGLRVPEDLSVIGFDDQRISRLYDPQVTTIQIPTGEIGYRAMEQLQRVLSDVPVDTDVVLPTRLIVRASTAPYAGAVLRSA